MKKKIFFPILLFLLVAVNGFAQSGTDDPTFNHADTVLGNGEGIHHDFQGLFDPNVSSTVFQTDGKIIIAGTFTSYNKSVVTLLL